MHVDHFGWRAFRMKRTISRSKQLNNNILKKKCVCDKNYALIILIMILYKHSTEKKLTCANLMRKLSFLVEKLVAFGFLASSYLCYSCVIGVVLQLICRVKLVGGYFR